MIVIPQKKTPHNTKSAPWQKQPRINRHLRQARKKSTSFVMPPKKVKKGESKIAAKKKFWKTASSPSKRQLLSSSLSFSSLSLPASSSRPLSSLPSVTTAQSCSNQITPTKKKKNDAYLPPGLLPKLSL